MSKEKKPRTRWQESQPWRPTALLGQAWSMALLGTTQKALKQVAKKEGANVARILTNLRRKTNKNFKWKLEEGKGGSIKLYSVKFAETPKKTKREKPTRTKSKPTKKSSKKKSSKKKK